MKKAILLSKRTSATSQRPNKASPTETPPPPLAVLEKLLECRWFRDTIRIYNAVLVFTSIRAKLDYSVVYALGPFTFRIQRQLPNYLQLYIFDTNNEVSNRLKVMGQTSTEGKLDETTVKSVPDKGKGKEYDLPSTRDMLSTIGERDIVVQFQSETLRQIREDHPLYMSLQYPLLFPYGKQFLTIQQYYASQIQTRLSQGMTLIKGERLLHQYVVDVYTTIEEDQLRRARNNQDVLRAKLYSNVLDVVTKGDIDAKLIGQRHLVEKYHDAMAICRHFGNPDLFITMTVNPNWQEIKQHLATYGGDSPNDRHDIECRVFKIKLDQLLEDFKKGTFFKPYTAEHQVRKKLINYFRQDPKQRRGPRRLQLSLKTHDPWPMWEVCTKKYPQPYNDYTLIDKSGYVLYRRRRDETSYVVKDGAVMNNTSVIPHNIDILKKYEAHINVEWCNCTSVVKYLFKYIAKDVDKATDVLEKRNNTSTFDKGKEAVTKQRNEIQDFIECCYLSACESMWRIFAFHIHKRKPTVQKIIIHLEGEHNITVKETDNLGRVIRKPGIDKTMFTERMVLCRRSEFARTLTILINKIKGPRSYDELKTFNDVKYPDYKSVCYARGYLDNNVLWHGMEKLMRIHERSLNDFGGIPKIKPVLLKELENSLWNQELNYDVAEETLKHETQYNMLNDEQRVVYNAVLESIEKKEGKLFFVNGAGIAALLLPNGRRAHSRFNIPLKLSEEKLCHIKPGTMLAELIENTDLIIWDETPMTHKHAFESLDKTLKDILSAKNPEAKLQTFGGKTVLLGGDFRQILPIIPQGNRTDTVLASISHSYLWKSCHKFSLKTNMWINQADLEFSDWVLKVGEGNAPTASEDGFDEHHEQMINVDMSLLQQINEDPLKQVVETSYGDLTKLKEFDSSFTNKAILTPRNETVDETNAYTISHTDGLPTHKLTLKIGAQVMLLRNLNKKRGLCNGTRLILTYVGEHVLEAEIIAGSHIGKRPVFTHGQLYVALSRVTSKVGLTIMEGKDFHLEKVKNIVYKEIFNDLLSHGGIDQRKISPDKLPPLTIDTHYFQVRHS
ncbi:hypothetical protein N665_0003s0012 [Sinapis alba]|nr:hypothetical protein N665_0003s0012 [Sinapis alba]